MTRILVGCLATTHKLLLIYRADGRTNADRTWTECFAQLVGTVLSLWDAAELDAAGQDGEVLPKFINLTDASIKMVCL
jgi:CCR4-NOT transcriptional complex subunit CAF120